MHDPFHDINELKQDLSMDEETYNVKNKIPVDVNIKGEFEQEMRLSSRTTTQVLFKEKKEETFIL